MSDALEHLDPGDPLQPVLNGSFHKTRWRVVFATAIVIVVALPTMFFAARNAAHLQTCDAINDSNNANYEVWRRALSANAPDDPRAAQFLHDLRAAYDQVKETC